MGLVDSLAFGTSSLLAGIARLSCHIFCFIVPWKAFWFQLSSIVFSHLATMNFQDVRVTLEDSLPGTGGGQDPHTQLFVWVLIVGPLLVLLFLCRHCFVQASFLVFIFKILHLSVGIGLCWFGHDSKWVRLNVSLCLCCGGPSGSAVSSVEWISFRD